MPTQKEKTLISEKYLISAEDYQRMGEIGIFDDKGKVELIDGVIYNKHRKCPTHNSHVDKTSQFLTRNLFKKAIIRTQGSIRTDNYSEPEPNIAILKFKKSFYNKQQATNKDTFLVMEVAITTIDRDREI